MMHDGGGCEFLTAAGLSKAMPAPATRTKNAAATGIRHHVVFFLRLCRNQGPITHQNNQSLSRRQPGRGVATMGLARQSNQSLDKRAYILGFHQRCSDLAMLKKALGHIPPKGQTMLFRSIQLSFCDQVPHSYTPN